MRARVDEDLADGRRNGVTATPTLFVDGIRYDGAWESHSLLEALDRPVAARVQRSARVFASLPTSAGLVRCASLPPEGVTLRQFVGAACLCGVGDTMSLLMADRAFAPADAAVAKLAVLAGSVIAGTVGSLVLRSRAVAATPPRTKRLTELSKA